MCMDLATFEQACSQATRTCHNTAPYSRARYHSYSRHHSSECPLAGKRPHSCSAHVSLFYITLHVISRSEAVLISLAFLPWRGGRPFGVVSIVDNIPALHM